MSDIAEIALVSNTDVEDHKEWTKVRLHEIARRRSANIDPKKAELDRHVGLEHIKPDNPVPGYEKLESQSSTKRRFQPGDILFAKLRPYLRKAAQPNFDGACTSEIIPIVASAEVNSKFILYRLSSKEAFDYAIRTSIGTRMPRTSWKLFRTFEFELPPLNEQRKIASVLLTVDRAIQTTEAIIAQAKRVKRGLMQDVLVGGITEDGRIRDPEKSPGQFRETALGKVPKRWQMRLLSELCSEIVDSPHSTPTYSENGVLIVRTSDIREGRFTTAEAKRISEDNYQGRVARLEPQPGDVVFTREAPVGEAFKIPKGTRLCLGQRTMVFRSRPDLLDPDFLVYSIYSSRVRKRFDKLVVGTTNPHLNVGTIRNFKLPVPSLGEQQRIVDLLNSLDDQIDNEKAQKEDLQRLKQGLMQDLLTGHVRTTGTNIDVLDEVQVHG